MSQRKVYGPSKMRNFVQQMVNNHYFENPPKFENDLKWPISDQKLKAKIINRKLSDL